MLVYPVCSKSKYCSVDLGVYILLEIHTNHIMCGCFTSIPSVQKPDCEKQPSNNSALTQLQIACTSPLPTCYPSLATTQQSARN